MPRPMSTAMLAAITATQLNLAIFIEANFITGPVYIWTGLGPIHWNGQTWQGLGSLLGVSAIDEGSTVEARGITLTLSGFDPTLLPLALNEFALLQPVTVYLGCFTAGVLIDDPITSFGGLMDQPSINIDGTAATIDVNCESVLLEMSQSVGRRYTAEDQQRDFPGDEAFNWVTAIQEKGFYWGTVPATGANV